MSMNKTIDEMLHLLQDGNDVDSTISIVFNDSIDPQSIRHLVRSINFDARQMKEKYAAMNMKDSVIADLESQYGSDPDALFHKISDFKLLANTWNLRIAEDDLREQGINVDLTLQSFQNAHKKEQEMLEITQEELDALKQELYDALPDSSASFLNLLRESAQTDELKQLLQSTELIAQTATPQNQEDFSVLMAAAYLAEHPDVSADAAAAAAVLGNAHVTDQNVVDFVLAMGASLALTASGILISMLGDVAQLSIISSFGSLLLVGGASFASIFGGILLLNGIASVVKQSIPYLQEAWSKAKPIISSAAHKVKIAALNLVGFVKDKVFRPAIHWVSNSALPVINDKVVYPLRRRLSALLDWLRDKKDQFILFCQSAANDDNFHNDDFDSFDDLDQDLDLDNDESLDDDLNNDDFLPA